MTDSARPDPDLAAIDDALARRPVPDGGPAFPLPTSKYGENGELLHWALSETHKGMSLRDYFAGQALAGVFDVDYAQRIGTAHIAKRAYQLADAMLAERAKTNG